MRERCSQDEQIVSALFHLMDDLIVYVAGANRCFCRNPQQFQRSDTACQKAFSSIMRDSIISRCNDRHQCGMGSQVAQKTTGEEHIFLTWFTAHHTYECMGWLRMFGGDKQQMMLAQSQNFFR